MKKSLRFNVLVIILNRVTNKSLQQLSMSRVSTRTVAGDSWNGTCQKAVESWSKLARLAGNSGRSTCGYGLLLPGNVAIN